MENTKLLKVVQDIVYKVTGKKNLTLDTDFVKDLELNSFDIVNIVCAFEDKYDLNISNRDVWKLHQVKDVIAYLEEHGVQ